MASFGVHSEVGKLRKVIVHRPDLSLKRLTPGNHDELLFDDVLWVERAQWEHDQFVARMRERGVEVFYVQDLLSEALGREPGRPAAADRARRRRSTSSGSASSTRSARPSAKLAPDALARHLIGGLTVGEVGPRPGQARSRRRSSRPRSTTTSTFVLPPLPNSLFTRDSSCWIYGGVSINPMYWPARRREAYNMAAIYQAHPMFAEPGLRVLVPAARRRRPVQRRGLRARVARGRRRRDHRQRHGRDRPVRADDRPG